MGNGTAARIAANRFGLGARPGDVSRIAPDPMGWLWSQASTDGAPRIAGIDATRPRLLQVVRYRQVLRTMRMAMPDPSPATTSSPPPVRLPPEPVTDPSTGLVLRPPFRMHQEDLAIRVSHMVASERPFAERLAGFWSNHFAVAGGKGEVAPLAVPYENEAIRPHVFGRFGDMLAAAAFHPAMMEYLDLGSSIGPGSRIGMAKGRSYNENYAREVMELHTVGVNAGYRQDDVVQLSLALTGWSVDRAEGTVVFRSDAHEPGTRTIMGRTLDDDGNVQGPEALAMLATHPRTGPRICRKLAVHFMGDEPADALVAAMSAAWRSSGGGLPQVYSAMLAHPASWDARPGRFKPPEAFVVSCARALRSSEAPERLIATMNSLGQKPFSAQAPTGYPESSVAWLTPGAMVARLQAAADMAARAPTTEDPVAWLTGIVGVDSRIPHLRGSEARADSPRSDDPGTGLSRVPEDLSMDIDRRAFILSTGCTLALSARPSMSFAVAPGLSDRLFVLVVMRGAVDGLGAVPPYGDPDYATAHGTLALPPPGTPGGCLLLDARFGLHPSLAPVHGMFSDREMLVVHAAASPYRARSHFDAQNVLENGSTRPGGRPDGWLNRTLAVLGAERWSGLAVGQGMPLVLQGDFRVGNWRPQNGSTDAATLAAVARMYEADPAMSSAFSEGLRTSDMARAALAGGPAGNASFPSLAKTTGRLMTAAGGPNVAVLEVGGWDTHVGQGAANGQLSRALSPFAEGLSNLKDSLGGRWRDVVVLALTEFGRTVGANGTGGTDHGTGSAGFLFGGAVAGGRVLADWPGLSRNALLEGRDLAPTLDLRSVVKGVLGDHLRVPARDLETTVFPDSRGARASGGLVRA